MQKSLLVMVLFVVQFNLIAQNHTVTGTIKDNITLESIPGVSISEKGTSNGVISDSIGKYSIKLSSDSAILEFRFIGYSVQRIPVNGRGNISINLVKSEIELSEFVVTALGLERNSKDLGYAVQKLEAKEISEVKSPNFVDNLAARVAGVNVSQGATGVGSSSKIVIRGEPSFSNNNPLFVVDGSPVNNNSVVNYTNDAASGFQEVDFGNGAMDLNPDDIESVTVLKGPSAAALYGTRASNGVIIITTKNGSKSKGVGVSINSTTFIDRAFRLPKFQNKYGQGNSGQFEFVDGLGGGTNDNITYSYGPELDQGTLISQFDSPVTAPDGSIVRGGDVAVHGGAPITPTEFKSNPNNLKNFYKTGATTINNVAISSNFNKGYYRLSVTDMRSESIIPGVDLKRKSAALNMTFKPIDKLKVHTSFNYVNSKSDNRPSGGYGSENINYSLVAWGPRSLNTENLKDYWQPGLKDIQQYSFNYTFFDNPYFILYENRNSFNRDRLYGNISAKYQLAKNLSIALRSGMDYSNELRKFRRAFSTNRFSNGAYAEHSVFYQENNTSLMLNYKKKFGKFSTDFYVGANRLDIKSSTNQSQALSLAQPGIFNLSNAASPIQVFVDSRKKRINSIYGIAKIGYKNLLFVDITGRNDWSSTLATPTSSANSSFFYPSFSASYIVSNNFKLPRFISFAKVRASWAQVGNDTDPYQTSTAFVSNTPYASQPTYGSQDVIANLNLLPERTSSFEVGTDIRFFSDRIKLDLTYYNALTENQIISLPVPISSGYNQQVINGGAVRSKGIEAMFAFTAIRKKNFEWNTFLNFSRNVSTIEDLPEGVEKITLAYSRIYDNVNQTVWFQVGKGGKIGDMYGTGYKKNDNGDFIIDKSGNYVTDDKLILLGNYNPDFILGITNSLKYKKWELTFLFDWHQGGKIVSRTQALAGVAGQLKETEDRPNSGIVAEGVVNVGTEANPIWEKNTKSITAESYYRQYYDRNQEENNTFDASYLKLRQFAIGYSFSTDKQSGLLKKGREFRVSIIGRNLFAVSKNPHFDPEQLAVQGQKFISGVEDMSYATTRSFGLKFNYNF